MVKKIVMYISLVILIQSCFEKEIKHVKPDVYVYKCSYELQLTRNIGKLIFEKPKSTDTILSWTSSTDYNCGTKENLRFANSKYTLHCENGMFDFFKIDSLNQITISWLKNDFCKEYDMNGFKMQSSVSDTFLVSGYPATEIRDSSFSEKFKLPFISRTTFVLIDSNLLEIRCECLGNNKAEISDDYSNIMKTIKIRK